MGEGPAKASSATVYLYCRAGPVTLSDPSGLDPNSSESNPLKLDLPADTDTGWSVDPQAVDRAAKSIVDTASTHASPTPGAYAGALFGDVPNVAAQEAIRSDRPLSAAQKAQVHHEEEGTVAAGAKKELADSGGIPKWQWYATAGSGPLAPLTFINLQFGRSVYRLGAKVHEAISGTTEAARNEAKGAGIVVAAGVLIDLVGGGDEKAAATGANEALTAGKDLVAGAKEAEKSRREIALGLDIAGGGYKGLAERTGAATYRQWAARGITRRTVDRRFGRAFHEAAQRADTIHFTLEGIPDPVGAAKAGAAGFGQGNFTNAELHYIVSDPELLKKTIFYDENFNVIRSPFGP